VLPLAGCSTSDRIEPTAAAPAPGGDATGPAGTATGPAGAGDASSPAGPATTPPGYAVAGPRPLRAPLLTPDILVTSSRPIPEPVHRRVSGVRGVEAAMPMSLASLSANGRTLTIAAADPGRFRRFTDAESAQSDALWRRVAGGEIAVDPSLPPRLVDRQGNLRLGASDDAPAVHVGAYAPLVRQISAVLNLRRAQQLGMPQRNALLVSTGVSSPAAVTSRLKRLLGHDVTVQTLALQFDVDVRQTAVLSGASVSSAVGTFTYAAHADGTVTPDPAWVRAYIRRETMPILGTVTGNKGMLPQLRAALDEVVQRGLAGTIHRNEYGGCYVPRFIAHDPAKGLSLHSWGMAVDLNVPGNLRGTTGQLDRRVVGIFKRWGFAWGGDWNYTDPMHFEMDRVVRLGGR
jgi:hypothetical protein